MNEVHLRWNSYYEKWMPCPCSDPKNHEPIERAYPANKDHIIRGEN